MKKILNILSKNKTRCLIFFTLETVYKSNQNRHPYTMQKDTICLILRFCENYNSEKY